VVCLQGKTDKDEKEYFLNDARLIWMAARPGSWKIESEKQALGAGHDEE
jgi:hypothetical protein